MENRVYRLYVGGLPANVSIEELQLRFARFGEVQEVHIPDEKFPSCADRPANRGFAFISLCTTEIKMKNCITTYSGCLWRGSRLRIANALPDFNKRFQFRPHEWVDILACEQIKVGYFSASETSTSFSGSLSPAYGLYVMYACPLDSPHTQKLKAPYSKPMRAISYNGKSCNQKHSHQLSMFIF